MPPNLTRILPILVSSFSYIALFVPIFIVEFFDVSKSSAQIIGMLQVSLFMYLSMLANDLKDKYPTKETYIKSKCPNKK